MGKTALIAIAAFSVLGAYYALNSQQSVKGADRDLAEYQYEVLARGAAQLGFERAKAELTADPNYNSTITGDYGEHDEATYEVSFNRDASSIESIFNNLLGSSSSTPEVMITSTGTVSRPGQGDIVVQILSVVQEETTIEKAIQEDGVPEFLKYGLITEGDLTLNGNVDFDRLDVEGSEEATYNANIHTNGKLTVKGNAASVRGYGTYVTGEDVKKPENFDPYDHSSGEDVVQQREPVDFPKDFDPPMAFDPLEAYEQFKEWGFPYQETSGNVTLQGTYDFGGTREEPYVWYVDGSLTASAGITLKGYVVFLVEDDIELGGGVEAVSEGPAESSTAFYAGRDIDIGGNATISGQIFAKGDVKFHGTPTIEGSVAVGGTATVSGTPDVRYYPASPSLTRYWNPTSTQLVLVAYSEQQRREAATGD